MSLLTVFVVHFCMFEGARVSVPLEDLQFELVLLPHHPDAVVEVAEFLVNFSDDNSQNDQNRHQEEHIPNHEEGVSSRVVEGGLAQGEVDVPEYDQAVDHEGEEATDEVDVHVEFLLVGPDGEEIVEAAEFEEDDQVLEGRPCKEDAHHQQLLQKDEEDVVAGVPATQVDSLVQFHEGQELLARQVLLPTGVILVDFGIEDVEFEVSDGHERQEREIDQNAAGQPLRGREGQLIPGSHAEKLSAVVQQVDDKDVADVHEGVVGQDLQESVENHRFATRHTTLENETNCPEAVDQEQRNGETLEDEADVVVPEAGQDIDWRDQQQPSAQTLVESGAHPADEHEEDVELAVLDDDVSQQREVAQQVGGSQHEDGVPRRNLSPDCLLAGVDGEAVDLKPPLPNTQRSIEEEHINLEASGRVGGRLSFEEVIRGRRVGGQQLVGHISNIIEKQLKLRPAHNLAERELENQRLGLHDGQIGSNGGEGDRQAEKGKKKD